MDEQNNTATRQSAKERQLRRLVVPAPAAAFDPSRRIDAVHNPDLELLWGTNE